MSPSSISSTLLLGLGEMRMIATLKGLRLTLQHRRDHCPGSWCEAVASLGMPGDLQEGRQEGLHPKSAGEGCLCEEQKLVQNEAN